MSRCWYLDSACNAFAITVTLASLKLMLTVRCVRNSSWNVPAPAETVNKSHAVLLSSFRPTVNKTANPHQLPACNSTAARWALGHLNTAPRGRCHKGTTLEQYTQHHRHNAPQRTMMSKRGRGTGALQKGKTLRTGSTLEICVDAGFRC